MGIFYEYCDWLEIVMNHFEVVLMIITALVFVYVVCGVFPKGMRMIFGCCGISFWTRIRAMLFCRTSRTTQRLFIEFALIRTEGRPLDSKGWSDLFAEFATRISKLDDPSDCEFEVTNCMYLTNSDFSDAVGRYFEFLSKPRVRSFYSVVKNTDFWVSRIRIEEAYVMPALLLSGLLARYEDNWEVFLAKYVSTASESSKQIMFRELYNFFAWLLWGPSRELDWEEGWDGLCQLSYGDESNSLSAFLVKEGDVISRMQELLAKRRANGIFGALCRAEVVLLPKYEFFRDAKNQLSASNAYFIDKIANDGSLSFVARIIDFQECVDYRAKNYYCTAYVWALFERDDSSGDAFRPETSVAFFEHANVADADSSRFLSETLLNKALKHFRMVYEDGTARNRKYRFVCGFYRAVETLFRERFAQEVSKGDDFGIWLGQSVSFEVRRDTRDVFESIDAFFGEQDSDVVFEDVDVSSRKELAELTAFYATMYSDAFPVDDERESLENFIGYLRESRKTDNWRYHVILVKDRDGGVVGGAVFNYFSRSNSAVIEFEVVDPSQRKRKIGTALYKEILRVANSDARKFGHGGASYAFCECESPSESKDPRLVHLRFWTNNWFGHLCFDYVQPPLSSDQRAVRGLWLMGSVLGIENTKKKPTMGRTIPADVVKTMLHDYVHYSMSLEDPFQNPDFAAMMKQLDSLDSVKMESPVMDT